MRMCPPTRHTPRSRKAVLCAGFLAIALSPVSGFAASDADIEALRKEIADLRARVERLEGDVASGVAVNPARKVEPMAGGWKNDHNWQLVAKGMTKSQVEEILGAAEDSRRIGKFEIWEYGKGKVTLYMGRVKSWEQP